MLELQLFGSPIVKLENGTVASFRSAKSLALLAYLALEHKHPPTRLDALYRLTDATLKKEDLSEAIAFARRQIGLEPWREKAHRQLIAALAWNDERDAAIAQYENASVKLGLGEDLGLQFAAQPADARQ